MARIYDAAVIGGGIMGCATALHLARGGMDALLIERGGLCMEASGRNTGTFTLMFPDPLLIPYTQRGIEMWRTASRWLGRDLGFRRTGGLEVVLAEDLAPTFAAEMALRREAGAAIEIVGPNRAREIEPALSNRPIVAAFCPEDASTQSYLTGHAFRAALASAGVEVREGTPVAGVTRYGDGPFLVATTDGTLAARRLVLAGGAWLAAFGRWFGLELPLTCRLHQGVVLERLPPTLRVIVRVFGHISLKQGDNGTFLIGTVLHWIENPDRAAAETDDLQLAAKTIECVALARDAIPALANARVLRTWTGVEGYAPDNLPVIGPLPGVADAYAIGCLRSGYTMGPYLGKLLAETMLGRDTELPIFAPAFDPARLLGMKVGADSPAARSHG